MKQNYYFKRTLSALVLLMVSSLSWAYDFEVDGIYYNITDEASVEVTSRWASYPYNDESSYYTGDIVIPSIVTYEGKTLNVTSIGDYAFNLCSSLTSITIPEGVTSIGDYAFFLCSSLTSVTIPESVTSIGGMAFNSCSSLISVTIPESVTSISDGAFSGCSSLTSITIPDGVTSIDDYAFNYCSSLTSVIIPKGVTSIGSMAFNSCSGLTSVTIPNSVTSIGSFAFRDCSSLTSVYSLIENPFDISTNVFIYIADGTTLYVPQGTKEAYEAAEGWKDNFSNVVELNATGIAYTPEGRTEDDVVYDLNGLRVDRPVKGIYIKNGKKVMVK